jgi:hypothetical protein
MDRGTAAQPARQDGHPQDPHCSLHSETVGMPCEPPGRSNDPLVKVAGLAWLDFEKPDLDRAERFYADFGFVVADRTPDTVLLRGRWAGPACLVIRRGSKTRFAGTAFQPPPERASTPWLGARARRSRRTQGATPWP